MLRYEAGPDWMFLPKGRGAKPGPGPGHFASSASRVQAAATGFRSCVELRHTDRKSATRLFTLVLQTQIPVLYLGRGDETSCRGLFRLCHTIKIELNI